MVEKWWLEDAAPVVVMSARYEECLEREGLEELGWGAKGLDHG